MKVCPYFVGERTTGPCARCSHTFKAHHAAQGARVLPTQKARVMWGLQTGTLAKVAVSWWTNE